MLYSAWIFCRDSWQRTYHLLQLLLNWEQCGRGQMTISSSTLIQGLFIQLLPRRLMSKVWHQASDFKNSSSALVHLHNTENSVSILSWTGHVFKSLNTSGLIPKQGKLIADRIDGVWWVINHHLTLWCCHAILFFSEHLPWVPTSMMYLS